MLGNSKSVLFIDNSDSEFKGNDLNSTKVRGTESSLILLAESFVKKNKNVKVLTEDKQDLVFMFQEACRRQLANRLANCPGAVI